MRTSRPRAGHRSPRLHRRRTGPHATGDRGYEVMGAALSNDPLGNLNPEVTDDINHAASVRLANLARGAGVSRFLFSSSLQ
jgi:nucleoside-diphosphate-sugar epimerase